MAKRLEITQVRSKIGRPERQRQTLLGLGLKRMHQRVIREDTPAIRGMVTKVAHLVECREIDDKQAEP